MPSQPHPVEFVPALVEQLYGVVAELERHFPGRRFTPDGHLVGSIGEVIAAHRYSLTLRPHSARGYDAVSRDGIKVEIKATQGNSVALRETAEQLVVLHLSRIGAATEIYNGPGDLVWQASGAMQRNGQKAIGLAKLKALMKNVPESMRLPEF